MFRATIKTTRFAAFSQRRSLWRLKPSVQERNTHIDAPKYVLPMMIPSSMVPEFVGPSGYNLSKCPMVSGASLGLTHRTCLVRVFDEYERFTYLEIGGNETEIYQGLSYFYQASQEFKVPLYPLLHVIPETSLDSLKQCDRITVTECATDKPQTSRGGERLKLVLVEPRVGGRDRDNFPKASIYVLEHVTVPEGEQRVARKRAREMAVEMEVVEERAGYEGAESESDVIERAAKEANLPPLITARKVDPLFLVGMRQKPWLAPNYDGFKLNVARHNRKPWKLPYKIKQVIHGKVLDYKILSL